MSREDGGIEKRGRFQTQIHRRDQETWPSMGEEGEMQKWMERKMCQGQGNRKSAESLSVRKEPQAV